MAIIPQNKQWTQPNDGDSSGALFATWGIDLKKNRGTACVGNPIKKLYDEDDIALIEGQVGAIKEFDDDIWASHVGDMTTTPSTGDIADGGNWSRDIAAASPEPTSTSDSEVFNNLLLVQEGNDIAAWNGSSWNATWYSSLSGSVNLNVAEETFLKVGPDGNLYITDDANKVYRLDKDGSTLSTTGAGTLDFSARNFKFTCVTTTSDRIFYGTIDNDGENAVIIEWDMGPQSISANRLHETGAKQVLAIGTWNDTPYAILSNGDIKIFNGSAFVDWQGMKLPEAPLDHDGAAIHKNGVAVIDGLPHFLFNPRLDRSETQILETTKGNWNVSAGVYCIDPSVGVYNRYPLVDDRGQNIRVASVGALFARNHKNTKFFASYTTWQTTSTNLGIMACEDSTNSEAKTAWLIPQPFESINELVKKLTVVHKNLGTGDQINLYYRRDDRDAIRMTGYWTDTTHINTEDDMTGVSMGDVLFVKAGVAPGFLSRVKSIDSGSSTVTVIETEDAASVSANDISIVDVTNFRSMGSITNTGVEISEMAIPSPKKSRQVWVWLELKQAAGNDMQIDYLLTE